MSQRIYCSTTAACFVQVNFVASFSLPVKTVATGIKISILEARANGSAVVLLTLALFEVDFAVAIFLFSQCQLYLESNPHNLRIVSQWICYSATGVVIVQLILLLLFFFFSVPN